MESRSPDKIEAVAQFIGGLGESPLIYTDLRRLRRMRADEISSITDPAHLSQPPEQFEPEDGKERFTLAGSSAPLSPEQETRLIEDLNRANLPDASDEAKKLGKKAEDTLIRAHLPVIRNIAKHLAHDPTYIDDLVQHGCVYFLRQIRQEAFRGGIGIVDETLPSLYKQMQAMSWRLTRTIVIPPDIIKWSKVASELAGSGRHTPEEIPAIIARHEKGSYNHNGITAQEVEERLSHMATASVETSPSGDINEVESSSADALTAMIREEVRIIIELKMSNLPRRMERIVQRRYLEKEQLKSIAEDYGVSTERVRSLGVLALKRLKRAILVSNPEFRLAPNRRSLSSQSLQQHPLPA